MQSVIEAVLYALVGLGILLANHFLLTDNSAIQDVGLVFLAGAAFFVRGSYVPPVTGPPPPTLRSVKEDPP